MKIGFKSMAITSPRWAETTGSISLCHTLIDAGLVDEYRLFAYPVVQGRGRRLFPDGFELTKLRLLESRTFGNIVYLRYATA